MYTGKYLLSAFSMLFISTILFSQNRDSTINITGVIYDRDLNPIAATHVINMNTHLGDVSDSLGIFRIPVRIGDTLLFRNIAFRETLMPASGIIENRFVILDKIYYQIQEARVFPWGSSYDDFSRAVVSSSAPQTLGESLGLPRQDPDYVPFDMDESKLKSTGFMLSSPISYLYYNHNKREQNKRKLYWNKKGREKNEIFDAIVSSESISQITGLSSNELLDFMAYMFEKLVCDSKCSEIKIYSEIYAHWEVYQQLHPESIPD